MRFDVRRYLVGLLVMAAMALPGCQLVDEFFNEDQFLSLVGLGDPSQNQIRPGVDDLLVLRVRNNTEYDVSINFVVLRPSGSEEWPIMVGPESTLGVLIEECDTNGPALIRIKQLGEDSDTDVSSELTFLEAYVWIGDVPTFVSSGPRALQLGTDFVCGDAIEYIVRESPSDPSDYEVVVGVYRE